MKKLGKQSGFSMIEIGVTLAIFAVLIASALPSMGEWIRNTKVRNAAESIQSGLMRARAEALRRNVNVTFWLVSVNDERTMDNSCAKSSSAGSWVISLRDPAGKCATAPSATVDPMLVEAHAAGDGGAGVTVAAKMQRQVVRNVYVSMDLVRWLPTRSHRMTDAAYPIKFLLLTSLTQAAAHGICASLCPSTGAFACVTKT